MDALPQTFSRWTDAHARSWTLAGKRPIQAAGIICGAGGFYQVRLAEYFVVDRVGPETMLAILHTLDASHYAAKRLAFALFRFDVRGIHERAAVARAILDGEGNHGS